MSKKKSDTRQRIFEAAWTLLESNQGEGVRMSDIAKQAGISRQALYLHFPKRAELLVATSRYIDKVKGVEQRLAASRSAKTGLQRLDAYIDAWGNYIPEIYPVAKAMLAMKEHDDAVAIAWDDRMQAMRHGCQAAVLALNSDHRLSPDHDLDQATDILWTLLSVRNWESWTVQCGWSQQQYIDTMKRIARCILVAESG